MSKVESVDEPRALDIVVCLDVTRDPQPVAQTEAFLREVAQQANATLEALHQIVAFDTDARATHVQPGGQVAHGFEVELQVAACTVSAALTAAEDVAELVCLACTRAGILLTEGYPETRVPGRYHHSEHGEPPRQ